MRLSFTGSFETVQHNQQEHEDLAELALARNVGQAEQLIQHHILGDLPYVLEKLYQKAHWPSCKQKAAFLQRIR